MQFFTPVDCSDWVYAYASSLDVKRDISVAPGGVLSLTSNLPLQYAATLTTPRVRRAWASPKFFFSA